MNSLYVILDDLPKPPSKGRPPIVNDAEIICLSVAQALLNIPSERRFLRMAPGRLGHLFPILPERSVYNKRLRELGELQLIAMRYLQAYRLVEGAGGMIVDSTTITLALSRVSVRNSRLFPNASYGRKSSHKGFYWGMRLHLIVSFAGDILAFELGSGGIEDERPILIEMVESQLEAGGLILGDKGYSGKFLRSQLEEKGVDLLVASKAAGGRYDEYRGHRLGVEQVFGQLKSQLNLEGLLARSLQGLRARIMTRLLAFTAALYLNNELGDASRSLISYDH